MKQSRSVFLSWCALCRRGEALSVQVLEKIVGFGNENLGGHPKPATKGHLKTGHA